VEIPLFARMVKLQADPMSTGVGPLGRLLGDELGTSLGAFSPSPVGDRLGDELAVTVGDALGPLGEPL
jgi:hypothetical protein